MRKYNPETRIIINEDGITEAYTSPTRSIYATATVNGVNNYIFTPTDKLKSITIERLCDMNKFYGYGVSKKANVKLLDVTCEINTSTSDRFYFGFGYNGDYYVYTPYYRITEAHRDENTGELSITAYDALYYASNHLFGDLELTTPYTIETIAEAIAAKLGCEGGVHILNVADAVFGTSYTDGANYDGTETLREILDDIAEATQTIYYIGDDDGVDAIYFKRLDRDGEPAYTIDKPNYITLDTKTNRKLTTICHATELEDNISSTTGEIGTTQFIRDNGLLELREDLASMMDNAIAAIGGLTINQFDCQWRGNPLIEEGDKLALVDKNGDIFHSYFLNDTTTYNGGFSQHTNWEYSDNDTETASTPSTVGEVLKQTYARVDKIEKTITLVASDNKANKESIAAIEINTDSITQSVSEIKEKQDDMEEDINGELKTIKDRVAQTITKDELKIEIEKILNEEGVDKVITSTGFTFNEDGLNVSKTNSQMTTTITEDGMIVKRDGTEVLVANHEGVKAQDLHAETYLIIGNNSRFEDYEKNGEARTGCFWIGG